MISWLFALAMIIVSLASTFVLLLAFARKKPSLVSLTAIGLVELLLVTQLIYSIVIVVGGARAKNDTVEYFAYLFVALMVPIGAAVWALLEHTRWSTYVLAISGFTVAVMLGRMAQIWG